MDIAKEDRNHLSKPEAVKAKGNAISRKFWKYTMKILSHYSNDEMQEDVKAQRCPTL